VIVVHSFTGNNARLARHLGERLGARVLTVAERRWLPRTFMSLLLDIALKRNPRIVPPALDNTVEDHVLFIAPLYDMHIARPMVSAIRQLSGQGRSYSFATLCGYDRGGQKAHVERELAEIAGRPPEAVWQLFVGSLFPQEKRENVKLVSGHQVTEAEMERFAPDLDRIAAWFSRRRTA
jgi:flavodoxin